MATVLIGADICPIERNQPFFLRGDVKPIFNDLLEEFENADLVIANLECPLIEKNTPIRKTGPTFGEDGACINGLRRAGIDVVTLANNHIMDHGAEGLKNTLAVCVKAGIATVGAGENLAAARKILVREVGGIRIGILALAEHEFSIATDSDWGANPLDPIDFVRNVRDHRHAFDFLIVLLHGGHEFLVPSPQIKDTCHFMVETGANAVIVQHPHCMGGYEQYQGGHIVYGQGALVMDEAVYRGLNSFREGFIVKVLIESDLTSQMEVLPLQQPPDQVGVRKMAGQQKEQFLRTLAERSQAVRDDAFVAAQWLGFCQARKHSYASTLLGHNRVLRKLNASGLLTKLLYSERQLAGVRNIVCCETHREAMETIFKHGMI